MKRDGNPVSCTFSRRLVHHQYGYVGERFIQGQQLRGNAAHPSQMNGLIDRTRLFDVERSYTPAF